MLRLRWNPFYPYFEKRIFDFVGLKKINTEFSINE